MPIPDIEAPHLWEESNHNCHYCIKSMSRTEIHIKSLTQSHSQEAWHAFGMNGTDQQGQQWLLPSNPAIVFHFDHLWPLNLHILRAWMVILWFWFMFYFLVKAKEELYGRKEGERKGSDGWALKWIFKPKSKSISTVLYFSVKFLFHQFPFNRPYLLPSTSTRKVQPLKVLSFE